MLSGQQRIDIQTRIKDMSNNELKHFIMGNAETIANMKDLLDSVAG